MEPSRVKETSKITQSNRPLDCITQHHIETSHTCRDGDSERKQVIPVSRGNTQCTCIDVTDKSKKKSICTMAKNKESLLAKIKLMIGEQRNILSNDFFNQEVEGLKGRVEQVECIRTHGDTVRTSLKVVSELEEDMKAVLALQEEATPTVAVPQVGCRCKHPNGH